MMNKQLIAETVRIVIDYFEGERIYEETKSIETRAIEWYNHTEITDSQTLAAVTMYGSFIPTITYDEIKQIENYFFPSEPIELCNFHISEIENSLRDELMF